MRRLRHLTGHHRTVTTNRVLGLLLAFNAGAVNAGGFLVVHMYTSHMTGFLSSLADNLVMGNMKLVLGAVGALWAFLSGAGSTAIMVNWARHHRLRGTYALPLLLEAVLLLLFGLMGAITLGWRTPFSVPLTVLLLAYLMGLQNAVVTKMSSAQIRTTHMTGVVTDLGIEMGKMLYWNRSGTAPDRHVHANRERLRLMAGLMGMFLMGGLVGAAGFKHVGFIFVVPLALVLLTLSLPPLWADRVRLRQLLKALRSGPPALPSPAHLPPHSPPHPHGTAHGPGPHETR
ncbi:uncharacterized membrane protein YoaK (UPF0700 family) [Acidovorax sp. 56]|uniref:YoaK family protein n=1 Tax=Acidovorax sp. 56 TaxID=2035205 RepID=UPI000C164BCE|nr:YoaK family protein [Acidovorax sp. 56]PIF28371.1 uncharacterized membrane protein YoaK (UPF0700 family) [Acidovorax sp. 56]